MKPNREHAQRERDIFASNLRRILKLRGKTQSDIVSDLEITSSTVSDWANAKKYPRVDKMQALADYLGVVISDLREEPDTRERHTSGGERQVSDDDIRAAFFGGADDLSEEEMDAMWNDAKDYIQYKLEQRRRKKNGGAD